MTYTFEFSYVSKIYKFFQFLKLSFHNFARVKFLRKVSIILIIIEFHLPIRPRTETDTVKILFWEW